jgi:hypothetical protein
MSEYSLLLNVPHFPREKETQAVLTTEVCRACKSNKNSEFKDVRLKHSHREVWVHCCKLKIITLSKLYLVENILKFFRSVAFMPL